MFQWILKKSRKNNKGFTLVELVVVIAILGILAGIAVPKMSKSRENAAIAAHNANVRTLESAATMYVADNSTITPDEDQETKTWNGSDNQGWQDYVQEWPPIPKQLDGKKVILDDGKDTEYIIEKDSKYTVTIGTDGDILITPGKIKVGSQVTD